MNKLTIAGYTIGAGIIASSWFRWTIQYQDLSQAVLAGTIGVIILGGSFLYDMIRNQSNEIKKLEKKMEGIIKLQFKEELK